MEYRRTFAYTKRLKSRYVFLQIHDVCLRLYRRYLYTTQPRPYLGGGSSPNPSRDLRKVEQMYYLYNKEKLDQEKC